ncbi:MAG TPA: GHKL domain-containing protein [Actinobacteria bacterium]|nr:GHKL domain-containing protein [Actinomycetota bacterium]
MFDFSTLSQLNSALFGSGVNHESLVHIYIHIGAGIFLFSASLLAFVAIKISFGRRHQGWLPLRMAILLIGLVGINEVTIFFVLPQIQEFFHFLNLLATSMSLFLLYVAITELHAFYFSHSRMRVVNDKTVYLLISMTIPLAAVLGAQGATRFNNVVEPVFIAIILIPSLATAYLLFRRSIELFMEQKRVPLMNLSTFTTTLSVVPLLAWGTVLLTLVIWLGRFANYFEFHNAHAVFHALQSVFHGGLSFALAGSSLMLILSKDLLWVEDRLIRAGQLMSLGEISVSLARDINNPLMTIIGYSTIMLQDKKIPEARRQDLQMIQEEASHAREISQDILDYVGDSPLAFQIVNVEVLLDQTLSLLHSRVNQAGIVVSKNVQRPLSFISADPSQIKQAFVNTLNNAIDSMPSGGRLKINLESENENVIITFSDSGDGIPADTLNHIFDPFYSSRDKNGTGLGLSLAKSVIQKHQGSMDVSSQIGQGTNFKITLPAVSEEENLWRLESEPEIDYF